MNLKRCRPNSWWLPDCIHAGSSPESGQLSWVLMDNQKNWRERSQNSGPQALQFEDFIFINKICQRVQ